VYAVSKEYGGVIAMFLLLCLWFVAGEVKSEEPHAAVDVVVVLDSSGSMRHNDPDMLRVPAAKLLFSLLQSQDRVAVVSFSDQGYPVRYLTALNAPAQLDSVFAAVDRVSSKGAFTNLYGGLVAAQRVLRRDPPDDERKRAIIFMSDGVMDVGNPARDRKLRKRLQQELLPQLVESNIAVHSVAFTEQSDIELLQRISEDTGGMYHLARNDADLHKIFADLFQRLKGPNRLPMHDDAVTVDDRIDTLTLLATKNDATVKVTVVSPDGSRYLADDRASNMRWFESPAFELITISHPAPGRWHVLQSDPDASAAFILSDLKLATSFDPTYLASGQAGLLDAWMENKDGRITDPKLLQIFHFNAEVETPDGKQEPIPLSDAGIAGDQVSGDGVYSVGFTPRKGGRYRIRLLAVSPTFERERRLAFDVPRQGDGDEVGAAALEIDQAKPPAAAEETAVEVKPEAPSTIAAEEPPEEKSHWMVYSAVVLVINIVLFALGWKFLRKAPEEDVEL